MVSRIADSILASAGLQLRCVPLDGWHRVYLRRWRFKPETLVDVGVGMGTRVLYDAYPGAFLVLVDPLREFEPAMRQVLRHRRGECHLIALGDASSTADLYVNPKWPERSSLWPRASNEQPDVVLEPRVVPVETLDGLWRQRGWQPPFGLKLDVEGSEAAVIRGAKELLRETQFVIAELPLTERFRGGYAFADFIRLMDGEGFGAFDLLEVGRNEALETSFVDVAFCRQQFLARQAAACGRQRDDG